MCVYCNMGDHTWKWDPPFPIPNKPYHPKREWSMDELKEYLKTLEKIKKLEDEIGCPCPIDRGKPDYVTLIKEFVDKVESYG